MQETPTITAAEIARVAGVGRAAVSNWRKRHANFPAPVGGTPASPEFDLDQVERWLREQGKLSELATTDRLWRHLAAASQTPAVGLAAVGSLLLARHRGQPTGRRVDSQLASLLPDLDALTDDLGPQGAFDALWQRFSAPGPGRSFATPDDVTDLMVALAAVDGGTVLDPAAGSGAVLRAAVRAGCTSACGQELDEGLARLAGLWLALRDVPGEVHTGDSLRADAFAGRVFDNVVCHPPFGATNWGDEELGHDPRWIVGTTPRTEPELAWVQHVLAHVRVDGYAVLLMPPTVASRRAGKRIRAELLRRGHLRAVIALPPGVAAPHGVPLHLWLLRRAAPEAPPPHRALLIDAAEGESSVTYPRVLTVWRAFVAAPDAELEEPGFARAVPVIDLLDEEVDITPARRQPAVAGGNAGEQLAGIRQQLAAAVDTLPTLMPRVAPEDGNRPPPETMSVAELARSGALQIIGPVRTAPSPELAVVTPDDAPATVLIGADIVNAAEPSGHDDGSLTERIDLRPGDVVVPVTGRRLASRVVARDGLLLGSGLFLLRPNPAALDPWFLAGQLRTTSNDRQATSLSGTRVDVRRAQIRRLALDEQRSHGEVYRRLADLELAVREVATLGGDLVRLAADGLAGGSLRPERDRP